VGSTRRTFERAPDPAQSGAQAEAAGQPRAWQPPVTRSARPRSPAGESAENPADARPFRPDTPALQAPPRARSRVPAQSAPAAVQPGDQGQAERPSGGIDRRAGSSWSRPAPPPPRVQSGAPTGRSQAPRAAPPSPGAASAPAQAPRARSSAGSAGRQAVPRGGGSPPTSGQPRSGRRAS
jgi:hypothetical protein